MNDEEKKPMTLEVLVHTIESLAQEMRAGFKSVQEQFTGNQKQITGMQEQAVGMQEQFTGMQGQLTGMQEQAIRMQDQFTGMQGQLNAQKQYTQQGFEMLSAKIDMIDENKPDKGDVDMKFEKMMEVINERTFTPDEKASLLATARFLDKRLEEETRGENNIPLTRPEYDAVVEEVELPNRFAGGLSMQGA